jgi:hypothetical protein
MGSKVAKDIAPCLEQNTHKKKQRKLEHWTPLPIQWTPITIDNFKIKVELKHNIHQINKATQIEVDLKDKSAWTKSISSKQKAQPKGEVWSVKQKEKKFDEFFFRV